MTAWQNLARHRGGATAALVALSATTLVGGVGFAVDWGMVQVSETRLQNAADAAATAAARNMSSDTSALAAAQDLAAANMPTSSYGSVVRASDVVRGYWNSTAKTFTPNSTTPPNNAVRVTARYAHRLTFGSLVGMESVNLNASATALATSAGGCLTDTSFVSPALPSRTSVVTQGNPCTAESGWTGTCYFATPQGNPIVRIDSAYNGPATVTFSLASPARTFTFNAPQRGSFYYVVPGFTLPNTGSTTMVFRIVSSSPTATISGGTATYVNRFNTTATLPGTCVQSTTGGTTKAALVR